MLDQPWDAKNQFVIFHSRPAYYFPVEKQSEIGMITIKQ